MADYGRVAALDAALVTETTARARVAALDLALVNQTTVRARVGAFNLAIIWYNEVSGHPLVQGGSAQGYVDERGEAVGQGTSFAIQGTRAQGS